MSNYISDYIRAMHRSQEALSTSQEIVSRTPDFFQSTTFEMLTYTIAIFLFVAFFYKLLIKLVATPTDLMSLEFYKSYLKLRNPIKTTRFVFFAWVLIILVYVFLLIYILCPVEPTIWYLKSYYVESFNYDALVFYFKNGFYFRVLFVLYHFMFVFGIALLFAQSISNLIKFTFDHFFGIIKISFNNICEVKPNWDIFKYIYFGTTLLIVTVTFFFDIQDTFALLTTILIVFGYLNFILYKNNVSPVEQFNFKTRVLLFLSVTLLFVCGILYKDYQATRPVAYDYKELVGISDKIVMLPYSKTHGDDALFNDVNVEIDAPIFADEALIYYPGITKIVNTNISFFNPNVNFLVVSQDEEKLLELEGDFEINSFHRGYYIKQIGESDVLYNYYFDYDTLYVISPADRNISKTLNILKTNNKLRNPFILWSLDSYVIIKDEYR